MDRINIKQGSLLVLIAGFVILILLVIGGVLVVNSIGWSTNWLSKDPAILAGINPFSGFFSHIGILFWGATSAITLFSALISHKSGHPVPARFLFYSGIFTMGLLLDDLFMFHEEILPVYLGIPEKGIYIGYFLCMTAFLFFFRKELLRSEFIILILSFACFASSLLMDMFASQQDLYSVTEDTLKLLGIFAWFVFFAKTSFTYIKENNIDNLWK